MFTIGESLLITQANEREEQTQQWWNIEAIWARIFKKGSKIKIQKQFSMRRTLQTSLLMNMSRDASPKCVSVWPFNYHRSLVSFR